MKISEKLEVLLQNEDFVAAMSNAKDQDELSELLSANGIELSASDLQNMLAAVYVDNTPGELDEAQLEDVAGGGAIKTIWNAIKIGWKLGKKFADWEEKLYDKLG